MKQLLTLLLPLLFFTVYATTEISANSFQRAFIKELQSLSQPQGRRDPDAYVHLLHAINYIVFGPNYQTNPTILDSLLSAPDEANLLELIFIGSQNFYLYLNENRDKLGLDNITLHEMFDDWKDILTILATEGPQGVFLEDLKPFFNLLKLNNFFALWQANSNSGGNFQDYLQNVFLAGLTPICKAHTAQWFNDIQAAKLWAITSFDATGKLPSGLQNGNINWVGNYKLCKKVNAVSIFPGVPPIEGKYCRATLKVPEALFEGSDVPVSDNIGITIGICVPDSCNEDDVKLITQNSLQLLTLHEIIPVQQTKCIDEPEYTSAFKVYCIIFGVIILLVVVATFIDGIYRTIYDNQTVMPDVDTVIEMKTQIAGSNVIEKKNQIPAKPSHNPFFQFILNCSMYSNSEQIFRTDNGGKFTCLNGIRALSMIWIIMAHTFNYLGDTTYFFLLANIFQIQELAELPIAQIIINGMYGVDTFFLMSAFLLTLSFLKKLQLSNKLSAFEWGYYYIHRYWRLLPPYAIIIAIYIYILPYAGSGPLKFVDEFPIKNKDCHDYWWTYLLFLNNFIPNGKGTTCMGYLWYVPNDYQLYAISPIFLIVLFKFPLAGIALLLLVLLSCTAILAFLTANVYLGNSKSIIPTLVGIWEDVYIKPYCRAAPWIIGIYLGYLFFKTQKVKLNKLVVLTGWMLSTVLALATVFGGFTNHAKDGRRMEVGEYAVYFSVTRISWSLSIAWIIFACHYGYGGVINRFLSSKAFIPLTRISYCAYLIHPVIMVSYFFDQDGLFVATDLTLIYLVLGNVLFTFVCAYFFTLFFELPFVAIEKLVMSFIKKK